MSDADYRHLNHWPDFKLWASTIHLPESKWDTFWLCWCAALGVERKK